VIARPAARAGRPFEVGDRFCGRFALPGLEDHAVITEASPRRVAYRYLSGTPLAGESVYEIADAPHGSTLTVTFAWQELGLAALLFLHRVGLAAHDAAVVAQVEATGFSLLAMTVPTRRSRAGSPPPTSLRGAA
jgi:hypothetical protein